ncbi:cell division protein FtsL [bacterium]|nr:cell division protein FtsL [bacterium]
MRNKRIPLVKNRIDPAASKGGISLGVLTLMTTALALMTFYVWMQIKISDILIENLYLEAEARKLRIEKQKLESEEVRLSKFDRIQNLAVEKLGMVAIPHEEVRQLPK